MEQGHGIQRACLSFEIHLLLDNIESARNLTQGKVECSSMPVITVHGHLPHIAKIEAALENRVEEKPCLQAVRAW